MTDTPDTPGAHAAAAAESDLVKLKTIAKHLMKTWRAVLHQRQYIKTLSEDATLIAALDNTHAAHVHNAIGVALVIDVIRSVGAVILDRDKGSASLPNVVKLLRKDEVLKALRAEMAEVTSSRYVEAAAAESLQAVMTQHAQGYYDGAKADLDWIESEILDTDIASILRDVRNKAVAHNDLVHGGNDWKLWRIEGTGLTYGQLDTFIDKCTDAANRVTHLALRQAHAYDREPEIAGRWAGEYAAALAAGLKSGKLVAT